MANRPPQRFRLFGLLSTVLLSIFTFTAATQNVHASTQAQQDVPPVKHGIGLYGGYITGSGISYLHYIGSHIVQTSFIADVDESKRDYTLGLSYARYLHHVRNPVSMLPVSLKFITGMDIRYQNGIVEPDIIARESPGLNNDTRAYFYHLGAGLGIDIWHPGLPGISFSLAITYALSLEEIDNKREWQISPLPSAGIIYSW